MSTPGPVRTGGHRGCNPTRVSADRAWLAVCPLSRFEGVAQRGVPARASSPADASEGLRSNSDKGQTASQARSADTRVGLHPRWPPVLTGTPRAERNDSTGASRAMRRDSSADQRTNGAIRTTPGGRLCRTHGVVRIERHDSTGASKAMRRDSNDTRWPALPDSRCRSNRAARFDRSLEDHAARLERHRESGRAGHRVSF